VCFAPQLVDGSQGFSTRVIDASDLNAFLVEELFLSVRKVKKAPHRESPDRLL
jgi:hypothetical protein